MPAVAALEAYIHELDDAERAGDDDLWNDLASEGVGVDVEGASWQLWMEEDGWTAARQSYESEIPGGSPAFGPDDPMGTVGPTSLSPEEIIRRLATLEFDRFDDT